MSIPLRTAHRPLRARFAWVLALLALLLPGAAIAQTFPAYTGLVVDAANVLPADRKAALEAKLQAFQQRTKRQLVVATIADMQGYELADYGYRLGRSWGVGLRDVNNGAILFIAPNEPAGHRGPRIEVGYGLEPVLTDAMSSVIINTRMMPLLRANDVAGALDAGTDAIIEQLSLPDDQAKARMDAAIKQFDQAHQRKRSTGGAGISLGVIFWLLVVGFIFLAQRRGAAGRQGAQRYDGGGGGGGSNWPIWLWAASEIASSARHRDSGGGGLRGFGGGGGDGGGSDGSWGGGGFTGGGGGSFGGGGASGDW